MIEFSGLSEPDVKTLDILCHSIDKLNKDFKSKYPHYSYLNFIEGYKKA